MSIALFFLLPIGLLAVAWSLCFVGCILPTSGEQGPPYSNTILQETSLVAYWPLSDLKNSTTAQDLTGNGHTGNYIIPPAYQPGTTAPQVANPTASTGLMLQQTSIVPGDAFQTGSKNFPFSVDFGGGYVSIPWASTSPALSSFTIEAWVQPTWQQSVMGFLWVVFGAASNSGTGFAVYINENNQWQITVGNGMQLMAIDAMVPVALPSAATPTTPAQPAVTVYVAVTFQAATSGNTGTLSLWINPDSDTSAPPAPAFSTTTTYAAVDPTQQPLTFFIGAGDNNDAQTLRTVAGGPGAPLYPYEGFIQSVALYQTALMPTDLASHFASGASSDTDT